MENPTVRALEFGQRPIEFHHWFMREIDSASAQPCINGHRYGVAESYCVHVAILWFHLAGHLKIGKTTILTVQNHENATIRLSRSQPSINRALYGRRWVRG